MNKGVFQFHGKVEAHAAPAWRMRLWGDFTVTDLIGNIVTPRGRKARALLAWLALHPGRPTSRERLCGLLWGERADEQARASLRQALFELKPFTAGPDPLLRVERSHISLDPAGLETDLDRIAAAAPAARADLLPDHDEAFLANLDDIDPGFDDWLAIERTRQRDRLEALTPAAHAAPRPMPFPEQTLPSGEPALATVRPPPGSRPFVHTGEVPSAPHRPFVRPALLLVAALLLAAGLFAAWRLLAPAAPAPPLAIAVLPFEDLSGSDRPFFAEGVSEEILNQLARNPGLKVLGRTSAASLRDEKLGPDEIGRRLGVDYLVEGSVRAAGPDVRVSVALVRSEDGARLWTEQYKGTLSDVFAIQDKIGQGVAKRLNLRPGVRPETALKAQGEAYALYLQARTMVRDQAPDQVEPAISLLQQALKLDPDFAPAWAVLGRGYLLRGQYDQREPRRFAMRREAAAAANRALALQPDLAPAHLVLGLAAESQAAARPHLEAAVRLDPKDAENWMHLSTVHVFDGDYPRALQTARRAVAIDPLWWIAFYYTSEWAWDMGFREEAEGYVRRVEYGGSPQPFKALMVRGDLARWRGDYSGALAVRQQAWRAAPPDQLFFAELGISRSLRSVGRFDEAARNWKHYPVDATVLAMWKGNAPDPARVAEFAADPVATWKSRSRMFHLLSTLRSAGRNAEIVRLYDARFPSPEAMLKEYGPNTGFIAHVALVAAALRDVGRTADADRLFALGTAAAERMDARGRMPGWHDAAYAGLLAATGQRSAALKVLERAASRGWLYNSDRLSFADIGDDPAFAPIRDDPRFQRLRAKQNAHVAREAREIAAIRLDPALAARFGIVQPPN
jgi:TolB-like protein